MKTEHFLIGLPVLLIILLVQAAFWVPSQTRQATVSPARLEEYIYGSIGDADILNPILNADTSSSEICSAVFDGLLDFDENLELRGRLATGWKVYERAYLKVADEAAARSGAATVLRLAAAARAGSTLSKITQARAIPAPWRVEMTLSAVDQDLFKALASVLPAAGIAANIEHNPIIDFDLRPGVTFHDGHPFTADDVKFTYEAIMDPRNLSPRTSDYEPVKEVTVLDPLHVRVVYKRLYSPAINTWMMGMLPKHLLSPPPAGEKSMRDSAFNRHPIGTGAFKFVNWKTDEYIRLTRNEKYWDGPPAYQHVVFRVLPDMLAQEMDFYAGTLDAFGAKPHQVERLQQKPEFQSFSGLSYSYSYIGYNLRRPMFKDVRVRRALGMAIDVEPMVKYLYYNRAERTTGPFPKQTDFYDQTLAPLPYDPVAALALLKEAGWEKNAQGILVNRASGEPMSFTLISNNGNDLRDGIMTIAQQSWEKLGIHVELQKVEWTVFLQKHVNEGNFDALVLGWSMGNDPDIYQIWHSSQAGKKQLNFVGYDNPQADELIVRIRQEYDRARQIEDCHALHRIIYNDQPYTFLVTEKWTALLDKSIVRRHNTPAGQTYERIKTTKTGKYDFYFNDWIKVNPANAQILP